MEKFTKSGDKPSPLKSLIDAWVGFVFNSPPIIGTSETWSLKKKIIVIVIVYY